MPAVEVADIKALRRALAKYDPALYKAMNREIRGLLRVVQNDAKALVPPHIPGLKTGWTDQGKTVKSKTVYRAFPKYNYAAIKKGIVIRSGAQKRNRNGFVGYYSIINKSAAGAILETAGRRNPDGRAAVMSTLLKEAGGVTGTTYKKGKGIHRDQSHGFNSNNPFAGYQFVHAIDAAAPMGSIGRGRKNKGRVIFRAVENDRGKTRDAILKVLSEARKTFTSNMSRAA